VLSAALALASSVVWGASDFLGGLLARRYPLLTFAVVSQGSGVLALYAGALALGVTLEREGLAFGLLAGVFGATSVLAFFKAVAVGTMSVASPLLATGSVVAFALAVAGGEPLSAPGLAGATLAVSGVVLTSAAEPARGPAQRRGLVFALVAPVALGLFLYLLGVGSDAGGSPSAVLGARASSLFLLLLLAGVARPTFRIEAGALAAIVLQGIGATGAVVLFGFAAQLGLISIASILSSLYPIVTVLLAHAVLAERLRGWQLVGVPLVLVGVAFVTAS
jgi:drug/metabolite transporter (DMT)-like permease